MQLVYKQCRYHENPDNRKNMKERGTRKTQETNKTSKARYKENQGKKIEYQNKRYQENPQIQRKVSQKEVPRKKITMWKGWEFPSISKTAFIIFIVHRSLYQRSVKLFKHEKYHSHFRIVSSSEVIWWKIVYIWNLS